MCYAKPGKRCSSHMKQKYLRAKKRLSDLQRDLRLGGPTTRDDVIEASLKFNIAKVSIMSPRSEWNNREACEKFDASMNDERGIAFDTSMRFQESANSWGGDDEDFKAFHRAWANNTDAYLEYKSVADSPRPNIPESTRALAAVKMREAQIRMGFYQTQMAHAINRAKILAEAKYGKEYIMKNGVPGSAAWFELADTRQSTNKTPPLTQESLNKMMNTHPEPTDFITDAGRAVGMTPPPGNVKKPDVYVPDRSKKERWDKSEGMFRRGTKEHPGRTIN